MLKRKKTKNPDWNKIAQSPAVWKEIVSRDEGIEYIKPKNNKKKDLTRNIW